MKFDDSEKLIVKEIIKDPRISDNQIAIKTGIPVKTVNRKRKALEEKEVINYYAQVDHEKGGSEIFKSKRMYIVLFKYGVSREMFTKKFPDMTNTHWESKHVKEMILGEYNGRVAIFMMIESGNENDIIEIFNVEIMGKFRTYFGHDAVHDTLVFPINNCLKLHHNYIPTLNMKQGKMKQDYPDSNIFV
ncbi:hypothetical protein C0585_04380 [Candidatus Woesearchaeota archaeon]|nr:MAG: hypothetical protein C0585_04380 [Candidatus Woesearchaeota archaeon]